LKVASVCLMAVRGSRSSAPCRTCRDRGGQGSPRSSCLLRQGCTLSSSREPGAVGEQGLPSRASVSQFHAMPLMAIAGDIGVVATRTGSSALDQPVLQGNLSNRMQVVGQDANARLTTPACRRRRVEARQQSEQFIKPASTAPAWTCGVAMRRRSSPARRSIQQHGLQPRAANIDGQRDGWVGSGQSRAAAGTTGRSAGMGISEAICRNCTACGRNAMCG